MLLCVPVQKVKDMEEVSDNGRVASDRAGGAGAPEPRAASQPVGAHPSRVESARGYVLGSIDERKAISRYLSVRASRGAVHYFELPWWAFIRRQRALWSITGASIIAKEIEQGDHVTDQAVWLVEIDDGVIVGREAFKRDSDGSGEADKTGTGLAEGDSADPKGISQGDAA